MKKRLLNLIIALFASVTAFAQGYNVEVCVNITGPQPNAPIVATLTYYSNGVAYTMSQTVSNVILPYTVCFPAYVQMPDSGFFAYAAGSVSLSTCSPAQSYNYTQMISGNTTITVNAQNCASGGGTTCGVGAQAYPDSSNSNMVYFMSFPNGVAPYTYSWVFSDGSTSSLQNPIVTFSSGGVNWGNVTVTDANGCVSSYSVSVQNTPPPPPSCLSTMSYQANYISGNAGEVFFNGYIGNSTPMFATYSWDFGDGSTSNLPNPQHTYTSSGYYYVCLTTTYNGCIYTSCTSIYVDLTWWNLGNPFTGPCTAGFMIMSSTPAMGGGLITIVNTSQGSNLNYTWNFGNGFISNSVTPFTTIINSGVYAICLTISDSSGTCNDTYCDTITVDSLGNVTRAVLPGNIGIVVVGAPQPSTVTAIASIQNSAMLAIVPNPSNGLVTLNTETLNGLTNIEVIDLSGKQVFAKNIVAGKGLKNTVLDLQNIANGHYLIRVVSENHVQTGKLIINH